MIKLISAIFLLMTFSAPVFSWEKVFEKNDIIIYADKKVDGLIPFKAVAMMNVNFKKIVNILKDHKNKQLWSPKLKSVKIHKKINANEFIFSEYYKTPWPATDREFLLKGLMKKTSNSEYEFLAHSINDDALRNDNYIQTDVKKLSLKIEKVAQNKSKVTFEFYGDMKGWMPVWLMNIIQKKWPYKFLLNLRKYSKNLSTSP